MGTAGRGKAHQDIERLLAFLPLTPSARYPTPGSPRGYLTPSLGSGFLRAGGRSAASHIPKETVGSFEKVGLALGCLFIAAHARRSHASVPQRSCTGLFIFPLLCFPLSRPSQECRLVLQARGSQGGFGMSQRHPEGCRGTGSPSPGCPSLPLAGSAGGRGSAPRLPGAGAPARHFRSPPRPSLLPELGRLILERAKVFWGFGNSLTAGLAEPVAARRDAMQERRGGCGGGQLPSPRGPAPLPAPRLSIPAGVGASAALGLSRWEPPRLPALAGPVASLGTPRWPH